MERSTKRQKLASVRQQRLAVDPGVSARSSTRPRRRCVLAASTHDGTSLDDDGVVERRGTAGGDQRRRRRRVACCTLTTGCLVSSASTVQLRFTATTVDCNRRTTSDNCWTPEVVTPLRHTASINTTRRQKINRTSLHVDRYVQNCFINARFPSTAELNPRRAHVGQLDRHTHKGVKNSAKQSRPAAYTGASCRCNVAKTIGTKIDDLE